MKEEKESVKLKWRRILNVSGRTKIVHIHLNCPKSHLRRDMIINKICHKPISIIHSTFKEPKEAPTQPTKEKDIEGKVEISDSATC